MSPSLLLYIFLAELSLIVSSFWSSAQYKPDAIQLVYTQTHANESETYHINTEALDVISTFMRQDTFEVVSFIGQARKGKSYTLSKIIQQMSDTSITPFKSSDYTEPFTEGIWMYLLPTCDKAQGSFPCSRDNKPYVFLDIQGSYTENDDESMRFATIVALLSSQTFLFVHQRLYRHDIDHIRHIHTIIDQMNTEGLEFNLNDLNLGAVIREPFECVDLETTISDDLAQYSHYFEGFERFRTVQEIPHFDDKNYDTTITNIIDYIQRSGESRMGWISNSDHIQTILNYLINEFNDNPNVSSVCVVCVFINLLEWHPAGEWSACSAKCDGGMRTRDRECNTGRIQDCVKLIGGSETEEEECNTFKCEWMPFGEWSECSLRCGEGTQTRDRRCSTGSSEDCIEWFGGRNVEERSCEIRKCEWMDGEVDECSEGKQKVHLKCESGDNNDCEGDHFRYQQCGEVMSGVWNGVYWLAVVLVIIVLVYLPCKACCPDQTHQRAGDQNAEKQEVAVNVFCAILVGYVALFVGYLGYQSSTIDAVAKAVQNPINLHDVNSNTIQSSDAVYFVDKLKLSKDSKYPRDPFTAGVTYEGFLLLKDIKMYSWSQKLHFEVGVSALLGKTEDLDTDAEVVTYHKQWNSNKAAIDSTTFEEPQGHGNPNHPFFRAYDSNLYHATKLMLGQYRIPDNERLRIKFEVNSFTAKSTKDITKAVYDEYFYSYVSSTWKYTNGYIHDGNLMNPEIGDLKMRYFGQNLEDVTATFFGSVDVSTNTLDAYHGSTSDTNASYCYLNVGIHSLDEIERQLLIDHNTASWEYFLASIVLIVLAGWCFCGDTFKDCSCPKDDLCGCMGCIVLICLCFGLYQITFLL
eukprot:57693_1